MKRWHPFRFPPLVRITLSSEGISTPDVRQHDGTAEAPRQEADAGYGAGYEAGERAGYEVGYAAGFKAGQHDGIEAARRDVIAHFDGIAQPFEAATATLRRLCDDYQRVLREEVMDVVAKVARQVVRCELTLKPAQILNLIDETLAMLPPFKGDITIHINPEDYERIYALLPERAARWHLVAEAALPVGECHIHTQESDVDAGCEQRLDACLDKLRIQLDEVVPKV